MKSTHPSSFSKIIGLGQSRFLVVDLTCPFRLDQEGYPGDNPVIRSKISDIDSDGWLQYEHTLGDHCFHPHCDAPNHFLPNRQEKGMEKYTLDWAFHKAFLIDLSDVSEKQVKRGVSFLTEITVAHLSPYAALLEEMEAIVIRTGYDRWVEANYPHEPALLPYLTGESAAFLASFKHLRVVGIDSLTVDAFGFQVSHLALKKTMIVESLVHLYEIPTSATSGFSLQTSPVRIHGATGGPVIAYAYIAL